MAKIVAQVPWQVTQKVRKLSRKAAQLVGGRDADHRQSASPGLDRPVRCPPDAPGGPGRGGHGVPASRLALTPTGRFLLA